MRLQNTVPNRNSEDGNSVTEWLLTWAKTVNTYGTTDRNPEQQSDEEERTPSGGHWIQKSDEASKDGITTQQTEGTTEYRRAGT